MKAWWLIHIRDRVAVEVTEDAESPWGTTKVFTDDWRKALKEYEKMGEENDCEHCDKRGGYYCNEECDCWEDDQRSLDTLPASCSAWQDTKCQR